MNDDRISLKKNILYFSIPSFISTFLILLFIGALPGLFYGSTSSLSLELVLENATWYFTYWFIVALTISFFSSYRKYKAYDKPIAQLSEATKKIASGDFSVFVDPNIAEGDNIYFTKMISDFNLMVKELGSVETLKSDFVSSVSHELKTPLAVIQNYASVLRYEELSEKEKDEYLEEIIKASNDLSVTVSNILLLNRLENQNTTMPGEPFDLIDQLASILMSLEPLLEEKKIEVHIDMEEEAVLFFDKNLIGLIWRNLLANAIKFSDYAGTLSLTQYSTKESVIVEIVDTGIGMDQQTLKHLFEKFYQADTSRAQLGNGLGLSLVNRVLELVDGSISCSSELEKGSTFTVTLPRQ